MKLWDIFKPVRDGTISVQRLIRRGKPKQPTQEEFISPLREELKHLNEQKQLIGYDVDGCGLCRSHRKLDTQITKAVADKEDPEPYLQELSMKITRLEGKIDHHERVLARSEESMKPMQWIRRGVYYGIASGSIAAGITIAKLIFGF